MANHQHTIPPRKPGKPAHPQFRCCRCAKSTRKESNFAICSLSPEHGGRLCEACCVLLQVDIHATNLDCNNWSKIIPSCSKCTKMTDELYTCACCEIDICYTCCTDWSINLFYGKQIDTIICKTCFPSEFFNDENGDPLYEFTTTRMAIGDRLLGYCRACDMFHDTYQKTIDDFCPLQVQEIPPMVNKIRTKNGKPRLRQANSYNPNRFGYFININRNIDAISDDNNLIETIDTFHKIKHFFESQVDSDSTIRASPPINNKKPSKFRSKNIFPYNIPSKENNSKTKSAFKPETPDISTKTNIIDTAISISVSKRFENMDAKINEIASRIEGIELSIRPHPASSHAFKSKSGKWIKETTCQTPKNDTPLTNYYPNQSNDKVDSKTIENFLNSFTTSMNLIKNFSSPNNHSQRNYNNNQKNFNSYHGDEPPFPSEPQHNSNNPSKQGQNYGNRLGHPNRPGYYRKNFRRNQKF